MKLGSIAINVAKGSFLIVGMFAAANTFSLSLKEAVSHTLDTNPEALAAVNKVEASVYEITQAKAAYLPTVQFDAGVGRQTRTSPGTGNEEVNLNRKELGLSASQSLFEGFGNVAEVSRQKARSVSAEAELQSLSEQLALRTSEVYLDVLRHSELLDLARSTLWEHQNIFDQMQLRRKTGVGSQADLDQISARMALANSNMIVSQNNLADAKSAFHRVTGLFPSLNSMQKPTVTKTLPQTREKAIDIAVVQHPTLSAAVADVDAAKAQYKASASRYWPTVKLEAEKRWDENVGAIEGEDDDLVVALRLKYDLFNGGADKALRRQTAHLFEQSKDVRNNTRRQVIEGMNLSWNSYEALTAQKKFLQQHVDAALATKSAYTKQFNIGRRTLLDLLNTETEVVESKRALINAEFDRLFAQYRIFNAMGELVSSL